MNPPPNNTLLDTTTPSPETHDTPPITVTPLATPPTAITPAQDDKKKKNKTQPQDGTSKEKKTEAEPMHRKEHSAQKPLGVATTATTRAHSKSSRSRGEKQASKAVIKAADDPPRRNPARKSKGQPAV